MRCSRDDKGTSLGWWVEARGGGQPPRGTRRTASSSRPSDSMRSSTP
jgi:hypothetical protein